MVQCVQTFLTTAVHKGLHTKPYQSWRQYRAWPILWVILFKGQIVYLERTLRLNAWWRSNFTRPPEVRSLSAGLQMATRVLSKHFCPVKNMAHVTDLHSECVFWKGRERGGTQICGREELLLLKLPSNKLKLNKKLIFPETNKTSWQ